MSSSLTPLEFPRFFFDWQSTHPNCSRSKKCGAPKNSADSRRISPWKGGECRDFRTEGRLWQWVCLAQGTGPLFTGVLRGAGWCWLFLGFFSFKSWRDEVIKSLWRSWILEKTRVFFCKFLGLQLQNNSIQQLLWVQSKGNFPTEAMQTFRNPLANWYGGKSFRKLLPNLSLWNTPWKNFPAWTPSHQGSKSRWIFRISKGVVPCFSFRGIVQ